MKKTALHITAAAALALSSSAALAGPQIGVTASYVDWGQGVPGLSFKTGLVELSAGYQFELNDRFSLTPEGRYFTQPFSVSDSGLRARLLNGAGLGLRAQFEATDTVYLFAAPTYTWGQTRLSFGGLSDTNSDWIWTAQAGIGFNLTDRLAMELRYEALEPTKSRRTDTFGLGARFSF